MAAALAGLGAAGTSLQRCPHALRHSSVVVRRPARARPRRACGTARAVSTELVEASQSVQSAPDLAWQIWAGALAGVTPFVVAGVEFSKRIAAQQRCSVCGGSGLVKKAGYYFRCGNCGGFLPWYSWKRFFKG